MVKVGLLIGFNIWSSECLSTLGTYEHEFFIVDNESEANLVYFLVFEVVVRQHSFYFRFNASKNKTMVGIDLRWKKLSIEKLEFIRWGFVQKKLAVG